MKRTSQHGVALVLTLILLSVITFMTITFLVISRRERGAVTTTTDQNTAQLAANAALEHAKARILVPMLARTNKFALDFLVSTNFINRAGFNPTAPPPAPGVNLTNVNYDYLVSGAPLNAGQSVQNIANLFYDPRPPVFVRTNRNRATPLDFRYYLDLNRNGRYDTNGLLPVVADEFGNPLRTNGVVVTDFFVGDPEWIGVLARPDLHHSATNKFVSRYAYVVVPMDKAIDLNAIHNQAKRLAPNLDGFFRNQGVGPWEINLAAFLCDLNTNVWQPFPVGQYQYDLDLGRSSLGVAFDDALTLLRYRYPNGDFRLLQSAHDYFGARADWIFPTDLVDEYSDGPLLTTTALVNPEDPQDPVNEPWPGADNANHFFTPQDLFDPVKTSILFTNRLVQPGTRTNSYDRYTFYRLMSQLGTESAPERRDKVNLNYINVAGYEATNFVEWDDPQVQTSVGRRGSELFFNSAAERLLRASGYGFGVTNIPVLVSTTFVYSSSAHRLLQLAANLYDSTTNRIYSGATEYPFLPVVFRPRFTWQGDNLVISDFEEIGSVSPPSDPVLSVPVEAYEVGPGSNLAVNVYGVPWVIGAKKGLPNFNEFSMESVLQMTRKLQITRRTMDAPRSEWTTNQMIVMGISNVIGVETWNSYRSNYTRQVDIYVTDFMSMMLTNDAAGGKQWSLPQPITTLSAQLSLPNSTNTAWPGFTNENYNAGKLSFQVPLRTNILFLPDSVYRYNGNQFLANLSQPYETGVGFPQPQWGLAITNKLRFVMVDRGSGRVIDYVHLTGLNDYRNLSDEVKTTGYGFDGLWNTNRIGGTTIGHPPEGIIYQIQVSLGNFEVPPSDWKSYGIGQATGATKDKEIAGFRAFYSPNHQSTYEGFTAYNTNLIQDVPFTPTRIISKYWSWQANDPLVHYTTGDLLYLDITNSLRYQSLKGPFETLENIGRLNDRYKPWGRYDVTTDPDSFNPALKDPLVTCSQDWQFPTNKFPSLGWLGRVHRGTPWQTIYLKATNMLSFNDGLLRWMKWTGNMNDKDAQLTAPVRDRFIFDLFTTAPNDNASRGQLSVNQSGLAAWSAVLSGVVVLTNTAPDSALYTSPPAFGWTNIAPAGLDPVNSPLWQLVEGPDGINVTRDNTNLFPSRVFTHLGDVLAAPALTERSPFLNQSTTLQMQKGISDAVYERIPQQILSLLRGDDKPRFVVYAYGQALKPAEGSILTSGSFFGMCTNYQIMAEVVARAVVRVDGDPDPARWNDPDPHRRFPPRVVIESFNFLPPD